MKLLGFFCAVFAVMSLYAVAFIHGVYAGMGGHELTNAPWYCNVPTFWWLVLAGYLLLSAIIAIFLAVILFRTPQNQRFSDGPVK
jgi:hypothetical protein